MENMSDNSEEIKITWIKNPNRFAFHPVGDKKYNERIEQLEALLIQNCTKSPQFVPEIGQMCAFYHDKKCIRVTIVEHQDASSIICLAHDYGFFFKTEKLDSFGALTELMESLGHEFIDVASLTIFPAEKGFDFESCCEKLCASSEWSPKAIEIMKNYFKFSVKSELVESGTSSGPGIYEDIKFTASNGQQFSLRKKLLDLNLAIEAEHIGKVKGSRFLQTDDYDGSALLTAADIKFGFDDDLVNKKSLVPKTQNKLPVPCHDSPKVSQTSKSSLCNFQNIFKSLNSPTNQCLEASDVQMTPKKSEHGNQSSHFSSSPQLIDREAVAAKKLFSGLDILRIFVHGKYMCNPIESLKDANFQKEIIENMRKLNFNAIYRHQSYSYPNILEGRSVFVIDKENSGKTFSYLPAILSLVMEDEEHLTPKAQGPIAIIIARSSHEVETIYKYCSRLLPRDKMEVIKAFGKWNCENKRISLMNGCDILVTTPPCFTRLAQGDALKMFNKNRIKHLIIDGIDSMYDLFNNELKIIIKTCTFRQPEKNPQLIVTSTSWMDYLQGYKQLSCDPILIMGNFAEVAVHSKCDFKLVKDTEQGKLKRLVEFMKQEVWLDKRTLIIVNSKMEFVVLQDCFDEAQLEFCAIDHKMDQGAIESQSNTWRSLLPGQMKVLIITDEAFIASKIKCAQILIHFSMPSTFTRFTTRFASMAEHFMKNATAVTNEKASTIVMLDDDNAFEIPRLIEFMKSRNLVKTVPDAIEEMVLKIVHEKEKRKRDPRFESVMPICMNILQFGYCPKSSQCKKRHVFIEADKVVNIPCDGLLKFELALVHNPAHYTIKVQSYLPVGEKSWVSCDAKNKKVEECMALLQDEMKDKAVVQVPVITNDLCALFCPKAAIWCRCKILEKEDSNKIICKVRVLLIDHGLKLMVKSDELMVLPSKYKLIDPLVCDLRILNLVPYDFDDTWDSETTEKVKEKIKKEAALCDHMALTVAFGAQNVIFAKSFVIRNHLKDINCNVTKFALKSYLLKKDFALADASIEGKLEELLRRANLYVPPKVESPHPVKKAKRIEETPKPDFKWKKLSVATEYMAYVKQFESPDSFYMQLDGSTNLVLRGLMKIIEECEDRERSQEVKEGEVCLVVTNKPHRGLVTKIVENVATIFLVDVGEAITCDRNEVYELPSALIDLMPFQAVKCRMVGIKPKFNIEEWKPRSSKAFKSFIDEECDGQAIKIHVVARGLDLHDVVLFHPATAQRLDLMAVQMKFAAVDEHFKFNVAMDDEDDENTSEDEPQLLIEPEQENLQNLIKQIADAEENVEECLDLKDFGFPDEPAYDVEPKAPIEVKKKMINVSSVLVQPKTSTLTYILKQPKIEWRQDDFIVSLYVSATDCVDYSLELTSESMEILIKYKDHKEWTEIFFYGVIDPSFGSQEKTGEKIIVRFVKKLLCQWPRLTKDDNPNRFIVESFGPPAMEFVTPYESHRPHGSDDESEHEVKFFDDDPEIV